MKPTLTQPQYVQNALDARAFHYRESAQTLADHVAGLTGRRAAVFAADFDEGLRFTILVAGKGFIAPPHGLDFADNPQYEALTKGANYV